ncbi:hypothetical protein HDU86_001722 [Geranomyces michiganensis]|nr:hypothetical protein HDU86_001722 [Geranomyces michiganensis]
MSAYRDNRTCRKPRSNTLSSRRSFEPQLVIKPPLQNGVDEADLLSALETFPQFKQIFFFPHFYLAVFATIEAADYALARLNTILPAPVNVEWDEWRHGDPQNGPLTTKTNFLPYFVVGRANPTPTAPRPEFDSLGDDSAIRCNETNGPDQNSVLTSVHLFPHGDEISVLMDLCSSFFGWERVHILGGQEAIVDFDCSVNARRFVRYVKRQTSSVSRLEPRPPRDETAVVNIPESDTIHLVFARKWQFPSKRLAYKRCLQWFESYQGFKRFDLAMQDEHVLVTFASIAYARAAALHIASTTNFLYGAEGFFSAERINSQVNPARALPPPDPPTCPKSRRASGDHQDQKHEHDVRPTAQATESPIIPDIQPPGHTHSSHDSTRKTLQTLSAGRRISREEHAANISTFQTQILAQLEKFGNPKGA